jgi:hypothetical protein
VNGLPDELILLDEVVACLDYNVVFVAEDGGDLVRDPFLHQVNVDLFNVDFLIELRWKFGRLHTLLVDTERHCESSSRVIDQLYVVVVMGEWRCDAR